MGWAVSSNSPKGSDYEAAVALYDRTGDAAAVDDLLTEAWGDGKFWIRRSFGRLPTLAGRHEVTREVLLKRNALLNEAFRHHERGDYAASVLIVLAQIDGITFDLTDNEYGFFTAKGGDQFLDDATVAGLPDNLRWHDLRHSAASIMLALGLSLHDVQKTLGWSSLEMLSKRYGHLVPELAAEQMAKLQRALIGDDQADNSNAAVVK
jgi:integrase